MKAGSLSTILVTAFLAAVGELAVVAPDGEIVAVNEAWQRGGGGGRHTGPHGAVGSNYWFLIKRAAASGDHVSATASDALEAVLGGYADRMSLDYHRGNPPDERRFRLRIERMAGSGHFLVSHEAVGSVGREPGAIPRQWRPRLP